jgi:tetratricopeptide (TPR) repeat protein
VYLQLGKPDKAVQANRIAIRKSPDSLAGYQNLFENYLQAGKSAEALKLLDAAATQTKVDADFLVGVVDLYVNYTLQFPTQREAVRPRAVAVLDRAAALNSDSPQLRLKCADDYSILGESDKATPLYQGLANDFDDMPMVRDAIRAKLVDIYLRANDNKRAMEILQDIIRDDPSNAQAYFYLGGIAYDDDRWADAADNLQKAILFNPGFEQAYYDLASSEIALDKPEDALRTLDKARQFPPKFVADYLRGIAQMRLKSYAEAIASFTSAEVMGQANESNRLTGTFYFQFGAACERNGEYDQAGKYFKKCLELTPDFSEGLNYLGYMWADQGTNLDQARELIGRALKNEPTNSAYLDSMGWVLYKLKQPEPALDFVLKAVQLSPEADETLFDHLGDIYAALHQMDKAREAWRKSIAVQPDPAVQKKLDSAKPP